MRVPFGKILLCATLSLVCSRVCPHTTVLAADYYVSNVGSDTNPGTAANPYRTFSKAISMLIPGDTLLIYGGTYNQRLVVNRNGTANAPIQVKPVAGAIVTIDLQNAQGNLIDIPASYVTVRGLEVKNSSGYGVSLTGQNITADSLAVHHIRDHGIYTDGQHITISNCTVYMSVLSNQPRAISSGWGSAIKVRVGGDDVRITGNTVFNNYGEGIAVTRGKNVLVQNNWTYDNYSVNIYVDNSFDVTVAANLSSSTGNAGFLRNGARASGIALAEEFYDGWGAQLHNVTVTNNLVGYSDHGIVYYGADVAGGGLDNVSIVHNTFWGSIASVISIAQEPAKTRNTRIANNIFQISATREPYIADRTGLTLQNNFWVDHVPPSSCNCIGTGDRSGDVRLAQTPLYNVANSFKLGSGSTAINAGVNLGVTSDYFGSVRPQGSGYDMGAHEYASLSVSPTHSPTPVPTSSDKPGDANGDGFVNGADYFIWLTYYGQTVTGGASRGDFTGDGFVSGADYFIWLQNYGR
jgi:parallel beta-helix repeat protein